MLKSFKYRIYPTPKQEVLLAKHFGVTRFIYNLALETNITAYKSAGVRLSAYQLMKQATELKQDHPWLYEVAVDAIERSILHMENALVYFYSGGGFPKFKKKNGKKSFTVKDRVLTDDGVVFIPKFREGIKTKMHRRIKGKIKSATVSCTSTGKYFISLLCDTGMEPPEKHPVNEAGAVGIDLGLKTFLVSSDGFTVDNPKFLRKSESRLKFTQRKYSRNKSARTRRRLATLHEKVANQRRDFLHKTSAFVVKNHDTICIDDLNVAGMVKNHKLAKSISDAGWGEFVRQLTYKCEWQGKNLLTIGRFEPSSKTCSECGAVYSALKLSEREWACESCGSLHDRDLNAATNIRNFALRNLSTGRGLKNQGELSGISEAKTFEAVRQVAPSEAENKTRTRKWCADNPVKADNANNDE